MHILHPPQVVTTDGHAGIGPAPWIVVPPPGPRAAQAVARDGRVTSPSNSRPYPLVVNRASGSVVEDVDGNRFLDFTAGIPVCSTGHCHPDVVRAIEHQTRRLIHIRFPPPLCIRHAQLEAGFDVLNAAIAAFET